MSTQSVIIASGLFFLLFSSQVIGVSNPCLLAALKHQVKIQQEQQRQRLKQSFIVQRQWSSQHNSTTRGTGKKHPFGEKRTVPRSKSKW